MTAATVSRAAADDLTVLDRQPIAVLGGGNPGTAQAFNRRDSGLDVTVATARPFEQLSALRQHHPPNQWEAQTRAAFRMDVKSQR